MSVKVRRCTLFSAVWSILTVKAQWQSVWFDEFNGRSGSLPDGNVWKFDVGTSYPGGPPNWGTGEIQTYTDSTKNIYQDGRGNLLIVPLRDSSGKWTSARIETKRDDFKPPNGGMLAIQAKIQTPNVQGDKALGYWPAFWALGAPLRQNYYSWPAIGEFDILENVNGLNRVWGTLHCDTTPGGVCQETNGLGANRECPNSSCQSTFHTYTFVWDDGRKEFRWYVDGQQFHKVTQSQLNGSGKDVWGQLTNHGYFVLLNLAIGGGFPNGVAGKDTPVPATEPGHPMVIDHVAVFSCANSSC